MPSSENQFCDPELSNSQIVNTIRYWNRVVDSKCVPRELFPPISRLLLDGDFDPEPVFTDFSGGVSTVVSNPDQSEPNVSANVIKFTKSPGEGSFAGTTYVLSEPLDFSKNSNKISMLVNSPKTDIVIKLKLEKDGGSPIEICLDFTGPINEWTEITFDFGGSSLIEYNYLVFFFDFGAEGPVEIPDCYYFDNVKQFSVNECTQVV